MSRFWNNHPEEYEALERSAAVRWLTGIYMETFNDEADVIDDEITLPHLVEALQAEQPKVFQAIMAAGAYALVDESEYFERIVQSILWSREKSK